MKRISQCVSVVIFISFIYSCSKNDVSTNNNENGNGVAQLSSFSVSVIERKWGRAIIRWTTSTSTNSSDIVKYKVVFNGTLIDSNLTRLTDTLSYPLFNNIYTGTVTAYTSTGLTKTVPFTLESLTGRYYISVSNGLSCNEIFTNGVINSAVWQKNNGIYDGAKRTLSNDTIFTSNGSGLQGTMAAISATTGNIYWNISPGYAVFSESTSTYFQGNLYAPTDSGVVCVNSKNGNRIWKYLRPNPSLTNLLKTNPVIDNNKIFVATRGNSGVLMALNLSNGNPLWEFQVNNGQVCLTPLVFNNMIIFTAGSDVIALDQNSGNIIWQRNGLGQWLNSPILNGSNIIVCNGGNISALNTANGSTLWSKNYNDRPDGFGSIAIGDGIFFYSAAVNVSQGSYKAKIVALDAGNGNLIWDYLTFSPSLGNLIYANNSIYSGGSGFDGKIWRLNALSGNIEGFESSPSGAFTLVVNNKIFYNHENGNYK